MKVSGVVDPDTTARATKSGADVDVHWVIAQGDLVAHGHVHADGKTLHPDGPSGPPALEGRPRPGVRRHGHGRAEPRPAQLEAFEWHQEVQLKIT